MHTKTDAYYFSLAPCSRAPSTACAHGIPPARRGGAHAGVIIIEKNNVQTLAQLRPIRPRVCPMGWLSRLPGAQNRYLRTHRLNVVLLLVRELAPALKANPEIVELNHLFRGSTRRGTSEGHQTHSENNKGHR
eukprot:7349774-Pyramimonas_sp.AAC.3